MKCPRHFPRYESQERTADKVITTFRCPQCKKATTRSKRIPRQTFTKPRTAIKAVSAKRKKQNDEYSRLRKTYLEEHPICQVCHSEASDQIHHTMGREKGWLLKTEHFLAVCGDCHHFIETNREEAAKRGFLKLRLTTDQINQTKL